MMSLWKAIKTKFFTKACLHSITHGKRCRCNNYCRFSKDTVIGNNFHFNGMVISGRGKVKIGDNFHSGKKIRINNSFHNFKNSEALPYDTKTVNRDVIIKDNVWLGESVLILGGVTIGEGAVIQAGSVVCIDVPPLAIAGGHPAIPFGFRDKNHYELLKQKGSFI